MNRLNEGTERSPPLRVWCTVVACAALVLALSGSVLAAIPASERQVLLDLYSQTNGGEWDEWCSAGWNGDPGSECQWRGITCDGAETHVERIRMWQCNQAGPLPSLSGLTALREVNVAWNKLTGPIPELAGLTSLEIFEVLGNQLTSIPALTGLSALTHFNASSNKLTGPIPALSGLSALTYFNASHNGLTGPIPALTGLSALTYFNASYNALTDAIPALSGLTALRSFHVNRNHLKGSIPALSGLTALEDFGVSENLLTGSIPALSGLVTLGYFYASENQLTGSIPALTGLTALREIRVDYNQLTGPAPDVSDPNSLLARHSALCPNRLDRGAIPSSANDQAWNAAAFTDPWWSHCTPPDTTNVMVVPVVAKTVSYETEVHVRNDNAQPITLLVNFYEANNSGVPGQRPCSLFTVPASATRELTLGTQCTLGTGPHFGMLFLEEVGGAHRFTVFSRSQTPAGVGFSVEAVPFEAFTAAPAYVEGLKRTATGSKFLANCFIGALGHWVESRIDLLTAADLPMGAIVYAFEPFELWRFVDVLTVAGAAAGDYDNVRVRFSVGLESVPFVAFCTMQESVTFGADFRIAKPADRAVPAVLVPIVAQTGSYSTEVHVRNHHAQDLTLDVNFHEADNSSVPGPRPCTPFVVPANTTAPLALGSQCTLGAGSHFGMLVLENATGTLGFTVFSRSQTPQGVGFSVEGFPLAGFGASTVAVEGLKRTATGPKYLANCFVGALGAALDYRLDLMTSDDVPIGGPLTGSLQANRIVRHLDVLAAAGAPAGDYAGVRAKFSRTAGSGSLLGFCTMQESVTFSADFRIGK